MKNNKFLSIFLIFFSLMFINFAVGEEIIFETPEIETFENGNLLKAYKGGKAIINNNSEIIADKFEYNKLTKILIAIGNAQGIDNLNKVTIAADELKYNKATSVYKAKGNARTIDSLNKVTIDADEIKYEKTILKYTAYKNVKVVDSLNNFVTEANKIIYLRNNEKILTEGKTKITVENKYIINSKNVVVLRNEKQISSDEHTSLVDGDNNYYTTEKFRYLMQKKLFRGNKVNLINNTNDKYFFEDALINFETNQLQGKDLEANFKNNTFENEENEPRLKGNKALYDENETVVSKATFTTCKKRPGDKCPPWTIESKEAIHNKIKKTIYYKNAWLRIYDVPVLYFPVFFHPDPTVKRQSGFLTPQVGEHQILGSSAYIPYFYVISDSKDLTFKPRIFNDGKYIYQTEYREVTKKTDNIFDVSLTTGHRSSELDNLDSRSHFFSNTFIDLDFSSFDKSNLEIQLQKTSNDTYLKLFNLESPLFGDDGSSSVSTLNSFINLTANSENLNFNTSAQVYETLGLKNSDRYQFIFPNYNLTKNIETNDSLKGNLTLNSTGSQHIHQTNIKESRIINDLLYKSENKFLTNGIKNNYSILLKNANTDGSNSSKYKSKGQSEILSSFIFESSYPLLREGINLDSYFTPKLSLRYSPNSMKNLKSENRRIDVNNIFSLNRIGSLDTVESGQSVTIGAEYTKTRIIDFEEEEEEYPTDIFELSLATVFRDEVNENLPTTSSLGNKSSDVVGHIGLSPTNGFFSSKYKFSLDNNLDQLKYNELNADFKVNNFVTSFKYIEENDNIGSEHYTENNTSYKFNENSSISFSTRRNKKIDLTEFYDLIYQYKNDCLTAAVKYKKEYYADNDLKPTEQLFFTITIIPLGAYESANVLPN